VIKGKLATSEWLDLVEANVRMLVEQYADEDTKFSFTEIFTGAPQGTVGWEAGVSSYHYCIVGRDVAFHPGKLDTADLTVIIDYASALSEVLKIYTPTLRRLRAEGVLPMPPFRVIGDLAEKPEWIAELHNMNAAVTAAETI